MCIAIAAEIGIRKNYLFVSHWAAQAVILKAFIQRSATIFIISTNSQFHIPNSSGMSSDEISVVLSRSKYSELIKFLKTNWQNLLSSPLSNSFSSEVGSPFGISNWWLSASLTANQPSCENGRVLPWTQNQMINLKQLIFL